jgi:nicotinate-nucleotide adenylyltransferase
MTALPISASDIRARLARGDDVSAMLPPAVLGYIREHALYT